MNEKYLNEIAAKHVPTVNKKKNLLIAFFSGGMIGGLAEGLCSFYMNVMMIDKVQSMSFVIVTIILITSILTGIGIYDKFAQHCGAGLFIPITGFSNALTASALECKNEGFIYGIGSNMFKFAGSVLTYGIVSSFIFGGLRYILFGG